MSENSTIYDVRIRYAVDDKATTGLKNIAKQADKTKASGMGLKETFAALGGWLALKAGKKYLIDYNSEIDSMRIGLTTILQMQLHKPFVEAQAAANGLFDRLQEAAKKSPATTKDFIEMANAIAGVTAASGGGVKEIEEIAKGAVIVAQAFGERSEMVAMDIKSMLNGTVNAKDRVAQQLLAASGLSSEKFNAMSGMDRGNFLLKAMQSPAIKQAAESFGNSFTGQVSTFQDQLQIALGKVGLPLMQAMGQEVKRWNTWIENNADTIAAFSERFSKSLVEGFKFLRGVAVFFAQNAGTLISIAKAFAVFKIAKMGSAAVGGLAEGIKTLADGARKAGNGVYNAFTGGTGVVSVVKGLVPVVGQLAAALPLAAAGAELIWDLATKKERQMAKDAAPTIENAKGYKDTSRQIAELQAERDRLGITAQHEKWGEYQDQLAPLEAARQKYKDKLNAEAIKKGIVSEQVIAGLSRTLVYNRDSGPLRYYQEGASEYEKSLRKGGGDMSTEHIKALTEGLDAIYGVWKEEAGRMERAKALGATFAQEEYFGRTAQGTEAETPAQFTPGANTRDVNVTIQKIEVASEDPDRFVFGAVRAFEDIARNPTQTAAALGGIGG